MPLVPQTFLMCYLTSSKTVFYISFLQQNDRPEIQNLTQLTLFNIRVFGVIFPLIEKKHIQSVFLSSGNQQFS